MSAKIDNFEGSQFLPKTAEYEEANKLLYATSSHREDHDMNPGLIVQPKDDKDIVAALKHARQRTLAISLKSGGHQYSGACSTHGKNIMMDLANTFKGPKDLFFNAKTSIVCVSVSQSLEAFNKFLRQNGVFVPHGQCGYVHVGGHGQTGGYGQLGRSFGLFGDHIRTIRMFDHAAEKVADVKEVSRTSDPDLFYAILGGSPGNFGVVTHYFVEVYREKAVTFGFTRPRALWAAYKYEPEVLQKLLGQVAEMADNPKFPRNYDLCVSVLSSTYKLSKLRPKLPKSLMSPKKTKSTCDSPQLRDLLRDGEGSRDPTEADELTDTDEDDDLPESEEFMDVGDDDFNLSDIEKSMDEIDDNHDPAMNKNDSTEDLESLGLRPPVIVVYAQWVPFSKTDKLNKEWFKNLWNAGPGRKLYFPFLPMSWITSLWIYRGHREFEFPYDKRMYMTNSRTLAKDKWADAVTKRIDMVVNEKNTDPANKRLYEGCYLAVQIQCFGGDESRFYTNRDNGTSFSWRDSTVCQVLDCFYKPGYKADANKWQADNDAIMNGPTSPFSKQDKRVLWGSYNSWDLDSHWQYYYEDEDKYKRLGRARGKADPNGTFTPNSFAVKAIRSS